MAPHSSTLAWKIPWVEEPGRLQTMGSLRVGHEWATSLSLFTVMHWGRKWQPIPVFLPGEARAWWAAVYGVTQSQTWLKRLSSSSSIPFNGLTTHFFLALNNILLFGCTTVYWFIHPLKYTWLTPSLGNYNKVVENIHLVGITMDVNLQLLWVNTKDNYWIAR